MLNVALRRALTEEACVLENVCTQAGHKLGASRISGWLAAPDVFTYLMEDDAPFGFVTVGPNDELDDAQTGELIAWYLADRRQGQGLGRRLLVHGLTVCKRRLCELAIIWLGPDNGRAIDIVSRSGFEPLALEKILNSERGSEVQQAWVTRLDDYF